MARKIRVEYSGAIYHVLNRGDRREPIFKDDLDRYRFLETLGQACAKTSWVVHAYCLMDNHFHVVIETPRGNLVSGMKWFLGGRAWNGVGVWVMRNFARNCWREWNPKWDGITVGQSDRRRPKPRPSGC